METHGQMERCSLPGTDYYPMYIWCCFMCCFVYFVPCINCVDRVDHHLGSVIGGFREKVTSLVLWDVVCC